MKLPAGSVVATSFLYLTVHRWIVGDVHIYLRFALKVTNPRQKKADFDRFCLIVLQPWELARTAIIANTKLTTRFPSSHRWTLCSNPKSPRGWLETTFGVAFHFFVAGHHRHFKFGVWIEHSKSQPTDDKPSLKWAWPRHLTHFKFLVPLRYLCNGLS